ncbi:hypothetical protein F4604DRAFT_1675547 [Suillus subluteus]|nr:hypothetical protein F4604DRAFT_1675547 [Suillus subluteus]
MTSKKGKGKARRVESPSPDFYYTSESGYGANLNDPSQSASSLDMGFNPSYSSDALFGVQVPSMQPYCNDNNIPPNSNSSFLPFPPYFDAPNPYFATFEPNTAQPNHDSNRVRGSEIQRKVTPPSLDSRPFDIGFNGESLYDGPLISRAFNSRALNSRAIDGGIFNTEHTSFNTSDGQVLRDTSGCRHIEGLEEQVQDIIAYRRALVEALIQTYDHVDSTMAPFGNAAVTQLVQVIIRQFRCYLPKNDDEINIANIVVFAVTMLHFALREFLEGVYNPSNFIVEDEEAAYNEVLDRIKELDESNLEFFHLNYVKLCGTIAHLYGTRTYWSDQVDSIEDVTVVATGTCSSGPGISALPVTDPTLWKSQYEMELGQIGHASESMTWMSICEPELKQRNHARPHDFMQVVPTNIGLLVTVQHELEIGRILFFIPRISQVRNVHELHGGAILWEPSRNGWESPSGETETPDGRISWT